MLEAKVCDILFLGLARDCRASVPNLFQLMDRLAAARLKSVALIGENGSRDGTREILQGQAGARDLRIVDTGFMAAIPDRLARMAAGREHLKSIIAQEGIAPRFVCVLDLDEPLLHLPALPAIEAALGRLVVKRDVFAISATSRPWYYDLLAFDDGLVNFIGLETEAARRRGNPVRYYSYFRDKLYPYQAKLTSPHEIECVSAFNGFCLYRFEDYRQGRYLDGSSAGLCEHIVFNRGLAAFTGLKMVVSPDLVVNMPREHGRKSFLGFWAQRLRKLARIAATRLHNASGASAVPPDARDRPRV